VVWWRSIHQPHVLGPLAAGNALEPVMLLVFLFSMVTFVVLFLYLVWERIALRDSEDQLGGIRLRMRRAGL